MNELRRQVYLQAMGVDCYVSRKQLPGAAVTRRLAIVRESADTGPAGPRADTPAADRGAVSARGQIPRVDATPPVPRTTPTAESANPRELPARFSLAAISCGGWLWLEELADPPFAAEQMQLLRALAAALGIVARQVDSGRPDHSPLQVVQFDWPMHTNQQLDLGQEAARSGVTGFLQRRLEQLGNQGLVLLGRAAENRVCLQQLQCPQVARTVSTAQMLQDPLLKKQAWLDLSPVVRPA